MNARTKPGILFVLFAVLVTSLLDLSFPYVREAHAIIGRPLTPLSYAGVARRTTRRAYYGGAYGGAYAPAPYAPAPYAPVSPYYW
jgi:hypothetical protein